MFAPIATKGLVTNMPTWDRFDICQAYYAYSVQYHAGQSSPEYACLGRLINLGFKPGITLEMNLEDALTDNGKSIFERLEDGSRTIRG